jgi:hypothetical protein
MSAVSRALTLLLSPIIFLLVPWQIYITFGFVMGAIIVPLWKLLFERNALRKEIEHLHETMPDDLKTAAQFEDPETFFKQITGFYLIINYFGYAAICLVLWPTMLIRLGTKL